MAEVQIARRTDEVALPFVCIKTGAPADRTVCVSGSAAPRWTGALIVIGFVPWVVAMLVSGRRYRLDVPVSDAALHRYRRGRQAGLLAVIVGIALTVGFSLVDSGEPLILLAISVAGLIGLVVNEWANWFGVRRGSDDELLLTRVDDRFRDAAGVTRPQRRP